MKLPLAFMGIHGKQPAHSCLSQLEVTEAALHKIHSLEIPSLLSDVPSGIYQEVIGTCDQMKHTVIWYKPKLAGKIVHTQSNSLML